MFTDTIYDKNYQEKRYNPYWVLPLSFLYTMLNGRIIRLHKDQLRTIQKSNDHIAKIIKIVTIDLCGKDKYNETGYYNK